MDRIMELTPLALKDHSRVYLHRINNPYHDPLIGQLMRKAKLRKTNTHHH